jgi:fatty acid desaturase
MSAAPQRAQGMTMVAPTIRDYSLTGPEAARAAERGLTHAVWYRSPLARERIKELMQRSDHPALLHLLIWLALLVVSATGAYLTLGTLWCVPFFFIYGVLYGSCSDSRWHEFGHGTALRTRWINDAAFQLAAFMVFREPTIWRWSHARHHTDTLIVGRDPEVLAKRPPSFWPLLLNLFALQSTATAIPRLVSHALARLHEEEKQFVPEMEHARVFRTARIWLLIYALVTAYSIHIHSMLPWMFIGLPTLYGSWLQFYFGITQHTGLAEDTLDHRLNSRTIYMNPIFRFVYLNMNYHTEHHMYPMVPYYKLPELHRELRHDMPVPYRSTLAAYREIIPALLRQRKDPSYFVRRNLPSAVKSGATAVGTATRQAGSVT